MNLAAGIRKHGFRRWHERALLVSHGWLVVALILGVMAFAALESLLQGPSLGRQLLQGLIGVATAGGAAWALYRFLVGLAFTQRASSQASCNTCGTFGRLAVVDESRDDAWIRVRCRQCEHEWVIES
jgi:ribosomal protein S27E